MKRTVDVTIAAELPRVQLSKLLLGRAGGAEPRNNSKYALITIGFTNYGTRAARVTEYCVEMLADIDLPCRPIYKDIRTVTGSYPMVIPSDTEYEFPALIYDDLEGKNLAAVLDNQKRFLVYGFIAYIDHLDQEHRTGFLGTWNWSGTGIGRLPDESVERGETFIIARKKHYTYNT